MDILIRVIADGLVPVVALLGAYALLFCLPKGANRIQVYSRVALAGLTALLVAKLIALLWQPDAARPFVMMGVEAKAAYLDNAGFPSDHVLFAAAIAFAVWFETTAKTLAKVLFALVGVIALGRVLALVHTPLDVLGGFTFAAFGALWYTTSSNTKHSRQ